MPEAIRRLVDPEDMNLAAAMELAVFGQGLADSVGEFVARLESGAVLGMFEGKRMIGLSSVIFGPFDLGWRKLAGDEAYMAGTMLLPEMQGRGLGKRLAEAQERAAVGAGKTRGVLTVRLDNLASLALRFGMGYVVTEARASLYRKKEVGGSGNRLIMEKQIMPNYPRGIVVREEGERFGFNAVGLPIWVDCDDRNFADAEMAVDLCREGVFLDLRSKPKIGFLQLD